MNVDFAIIDYPPKPDHISKVLLTLAKAYDLAIWVCLTLSRILLRVSKRLIIGTAFRLRHLS